MAENSLIESDSQLFSINNGSFATNSQIDNQMSTVCDGTQYYSALNDTEASIMAEKEEDQVTLYRIEDSEELYAVQFSKDEQGKVQKYQFKVRENTEGQLEAIPGTIVLQPEGVDHVYYENNLKNSKSSTDNFTKENSDIFYMSNDSSSNKKEKIKNEPSIIKNTEINKTDKNLIFKNDTQLNNLSTSKPKIEPLFSDDSCSIITNDISGTPNDIRNNQTDIVITTNSITSVTNDMTSSPASITNYLTANFDISTSSATVANTSIMSNQTLLNESNKDDSTKLTEFYDFSKCDTTLLDNSSSTVVVSKDHQINDSFVEIISNELVNSTSLQTDSKRSLKLSNDIKKIDDHPKSVDVVNLFKNENGSLSSGGTLDELTLEKINESNLILDNNFKLLTENTNFVSMETTTPPSTDTKDLTNLTPYMDVIKCENATFTESKVIPMDLELTDLIPRKNEIVKIETGSKQIDDHLVQENLVKIEKNPSSIEIKTNDALKQEQIVSPITICENKTNDNGKKMIIVKATAVKNCAKETETVTKPIDKVVTNPPSSIFLKKSPRKQFFQKLTNHQTKKSQATVKKKSVFVNQQQQSQQQPPLILFNQSLNVPNQNLKQQLTTSQFLKTTTVPSKPKGNQIMLALPNVIDKSGNQIVLVLSPQKSLQTNESTKNTNLQTNESTNINLKTNELINLQASNNLDLKKTNDLINLQTSNNLNLRKTNELTQQQSTKLTNVPKILSTTTKTSSTNHQIASASTSTINNSSKSINVSLNLPTSTPLNNLNKIPNQPAFIDLSTEQSDELLTCETDDSKNQLKNNETLVKIKPKATPTNELQQLTIEKKLLTKKSTSSSTFVAPSENQIDLLEINKPKNKINILNCKPKISNILKAAEKKETIVADDTKGCESPVKTVVNLLKRSANEVIEQIDDITITKSQVSLASRTPRKQTIQVVERIDDHIIITDDEIDDNSKKIVNILAKKRGRPVKKNVLSKQLTAQIVDDDLKLNDQIDDDDDDTKIDDTSDDKIKLRKRKCPNKSLMSNDYIFEMDFDFDDDDDHNFVTSTPAVNEVKKKRGRKPKQDMLKNDMKCSNDDKKNVSTNDSNEITITVESVDGKKLDDEAESSSMRNESPLIYNLLVNKQNSKVLKLYERKRISGKKTSLNDNNEKLSVVEQINQIDNDNKLIDTNVILSSNDADVKNKLLNLDDDHLETAKESNDVVNDMKKIDEVVLHECKECKLTFDNAGQFEKHIRINHKHATLKKCNKCSKMFLSNTNYLAHIREHIKENLLKKSNGDVCDETKKKLRKSTQYKSEFSEIVRTAEENSRIELLTERKRSLSGGSIDLNKLSSSQTNQQCATDSIKTTSDDQLTCLVCFKTFRQLVYLVQHREIHKVNQIVENKCLKCQQQFENSVLLRTHRCPAFEELNVWNAKQKRERKLTMTKNTSVAAAAQIKCRQCSKTCRTKDLLRKHKCSTNVHEINRMRTSCNEKEKMNLKVEEIDIKEEKTNVKVEKEDVKVENEMNEEKNEKDRKTNKQESKIPIVNNNKIQEDTDGVNKKDEKQMRNETKIDNQKLNANKRKSIGGDGVLKKRLTMSGTQKMNTRRSTACDINAVDRKISLPLSFLGKKRTMEEYLEPSNVKRRRSFIKCQECEMQFISDFNLAKHIQERHFTFRQTKRMRKDDDDVKRSSVTKNAKTTTSKKIDDKQMNMKKIENKKNVLSISKKSNDTSTSKKLLTSNNRSISNSNKKVVRLQKAGTISNSTNVATKKSKLGNKLVFKY